MYLDFHTHSCINQEDTLSILNVVLNGESLHNQESFREREAVSIGIHPWYIDKDSLEDMLEFLSDEGKRNNVKCIGEAGLDKLKGADLQTQEKVFLAQLRIAEKLKKSLVIHCVRAFNELVAIEKVLKPKIPMIIHGFSRKADLARELINKNFRLSFGASLLEKEHVQDAFVATPLDKLFLETDDREDVTIQEIYQKAAVLKGLDLESIKMSIWENFKQVIEH